METTRIYKRVLHMKVGSRVIYLLKSEIYLMDYSLEGWMLVLQLNFTSLGSCI